MESRPIGVFDSGLGGLTAVRQLRRIMPSEHIIYFGDTSRVPYGNRSADTILKYARQDLRFLRSFDLKAAVIACGTVSSNCLGTLQQENDIPIVGVVEPAVRRAAAVTENRRVGQCQLRGLPAALPPGPPGHRPLCQGLPPLRPPGGGGALPARGCGD